MARFEPELAPGETPPPASVHPRDATKDAPTSVGRFNQTIRDFVSAWGSVWIEGEITSWNLRAGNVYGRLTDPDSDASIAFRIWGSVRSRLADDLKVGDHVVASVKADYFVKSGDFSVIVSAMHPLGLGDQFERIERLRAALYAEGLFDASRKRPLPFLPQRIGLITGERSDAEKDVLRNAELRWPGVRFRVEHAAVQGERSVGEIVAALELLDADPDVDVIVIARGGGDPLHLLGFSDERLVRAVAAASTPVVSAIGHENDHPILDDVADLRASTPTDAAKRVVPDVGEQRAIVQQLRARATLRLTQRVQHDIAQLEQLRSRPVLRTPDALLDPRVHELVLLTARGRDTVDRRWDAAARQSAELRAALRALSPGATLARGYAIAYHPDGRVLRDAADAPTGSALVVTVGRGSLAARSEGELAEGPSAATAGD
ncbi:MAG: exodeoxyribonuclease VII large subunit [Microbacterium sp. SCN 71-21]|uniref:exodeoxyribonuclease VII large subunit n=1 Tax=Microbacterium sp. SCN 71-21 TaxID=1660116 RepID=UPI00086D8B7C|nr:exodeoxyribonuclease VII large subunit [Microbacterium sp. SCN 71-21]ODU77829.1 MAG: exodeoxyribonuclease VII large subunit [Microbacterium sp. SCN 71-21]